MTVQWIEVGRMWQPFIDEVAAVLSPLFLGDACIVNNKTPSSLSVNINSPNLVHMCGYKLPITGQKLAQTGFA